MTYNVLSGTLSLYTTTTFASALFFIYVANIDAFAYRKAISWSWNCNPNFFSETLIRARLLWPVSELFVVGDNYIHVNMSHALFFFIFFYSQRMSMLFNARYRLGCFYVIVVDFSPFFLGVCGQQLTCVASKSVIMGVASGPRPSFFISLFFPTGKIHWLGCVASSVPRPSYFGPNAL